MYTVPSLVCQEQRGLLGRVLPHISPVPVVVLWALRHGTGSFAKQASHLAGGGALASCQVLPECLCLADARQTFLLKSKYYKPGATGVANKINRSLEVLTLLPHPLPSPPSLYPETQQEGKKVPAAETAGTWCRKEAWCLFPTRPTCTRERPYRGPSRISAPHSVCACVCMCICKYACVYIYIKHLGRNVCCSA